MIVSLTYDNVFYPVFDTEHPPARVPENIVLVAVKTTLGSDIDLMATSAKSSVLEDGSDPDTASLKHKEAVDYLNTANPDDKNYPFLRLEAGRSDTTVRQLAKEVKESYDKQQLQLAEIESTRIFGKSQVNKSVDQQAATFVITQIQQQFSEIINE